MTMKKLISAALSLAMLGSAQVYALSMPTIAVHAAYSNSAEDTLKYLKYENAGDHIEITGCDTDISGNIIIPNEIDALPVTVIKSGAFTDCRNDVSYIYVPENVQKIEKEGIFWISDTAVVHIENTDCVLETWAIGGNYTNSGAVFNGIIAGKLNSTAQAYAKTFGFTFETAYETYEAVEPTCTEPTCTTADDTVATTTAVSSAYNPTSTQTRTASGYDTSACGFTITTNTETVQRYTPERDYIVTIPAIAADYEPEYPLYENAKITVHVIDSVTNLPVNDAVVEFAKTNTLNSTDIKDYYGSWNTSNSNPFIVEFDYETVPYTISGQDDSFLLTAYISNVPENYSYNGKSYAIQDKLLQVGGYKFTSYDTTEIFFYLDPTEPTVTTTAATNSNSVNMIVGDIITVPIYYNSKITSASTITAVSSDKNIVNIDEIEKLSDCANIHLSATDGGEATIDIYVDGEYYTTIYADVLICALTTTSTTVSSSTKYYNCAACGKAFPKEELIFTPLTQFCHDCYISGMGGTTTSPHTDTTTQTTVTETVTGYTSSGTITLTTVSSQENKNLTLTGTITDITNYNSIVLSDYYEFCFDESGNESDILLNYKIGDVIKIDLNYTNFMTTSGLRAHIDSIDGITLLKTESDIYGDANKDGTLNIADSVIILQSVSNPDKYTLTESGKYLADVVDNDGVTAKDALYIQMAEAKAIDAGLFPVTS